MNKLLKESTHFLRALWHGFRNAETEVLLFMLVLILGIGTLFYAHMENWTYLDALYFSVTTLTTIGFGDIAPQTDIGKFFTIGYIFSGLIIFLGFVNTLVKQAVEEQQGDEKLELLRMKEQAFYKELKKYK